MKRPALLLIVIAVLGISAFAYFGWRPRQNTQEIPTPKIPSEQPLSEPTQNFEYSPPAISDFSKLEIHAGADVEILLTDPQGNKTGFDVSFGSIIIEIPGSSFDRDVLDDDVTGASGVESSIIFVKTPPGGNYNLEVMSNEPSLFFVQLNAWDVAGQSSAISTLSGVGAPGSPSRFTIEYLSAPGAIPAIARFATFFSTRDDVNTSFDLGLIDADIAQNLIQQLDEARIKQEQGELNAAKNILQGFINAVEVERGKHIMPKISTILVEDAQFLIEQL